MYNSMDYEQWFYKSRFCNNLLNCIIVVCNPEQIDFIAHSDYFVGDKFSTDWDKAWTNFKKQGKKSLFSGFSADKYVTWNPRRSEFPLSEEVDPIKRTERSNLMLWTSPRFTLAVAILIVTFLLVYTILAPVK